MKETLGDRVLKFYHNYIAPTPKEIELEKKETKATAPVKDSSSTRKDEIGTDELSLERCREVALQTPLLMKGIRKKSMDTVRNWFIVDTLEGKGNPIKEDLQIIHDFETRDNFKGKVYDVLTNSKVYGDGYLLITYVKYINGIPSPEPEGTNLADRPQPGYVPFSTRIINSEFIKDVDYLNENYQKYGILHYVYNDPEKAVFTEGKPGQYIHPDRIFRIPYDRLPHKFFGNSAVNLLRNIIQSKINVDISCGEILAWFAHGVFDVKIESMNDNDETVWVRKMNAHPGAYIHDERATLTSIKPEAIDPKSFYEYLILNIAAGVRIPKQVLTGNEPGRVTGAEVGFGDYYKDIKDEQDIIITPLVEKLYKRLLEGRSRNWKYKIVWQPVYVDESNEIAMLEKKVNTAEKALNGTKGVGGFIDTAEAREIFNRGQIPLDVNKKIKPKVQSQPEPKPESKPEQPAEKDKEEETEKMHIRGGLSEEEKQMIARCKAAHDREIKAIAEKEKELGNKILNEQNDNSN